MPEVLVAGNSAAYVVIVWQNWSSSLLLQM